MEKLINHFELYFPLTKNVKRANPINKVKLSASSKQLKNELILLNDEILTERDKSIRHVATEARKIHCILCR
jgi:hypothetical protein